MGHIYTLIAYGFDSNERDEIVIDFYVVQLSDGQTWPRYERRFDDPDLITPIAFYSKRAIAMSDASRQVEAVLANLVQRGAKLAQAERPSIPLVTVNDLAKLVAESMARHEEDDARFSAQLAERAAQRRAEKKTTTRKAKTA